MTGLAHSWITKHTLRRALKSITGLILRKDYTFGLAQVVVAVRGQAQRVMYKLSDKSKYYDSLVKALEDRFAPLTRQNCIGFN